jgi:hypothetical protein
LCAGMQAVGHLAEGGDQTMPPLQFIISSCVQGGA